MPGPCWVRAPASGDRSGAAIPCAREGFEVTERAAAWTADSAEAPRIFLPGGALPRAGERLINGDVAVTLERMAGPGRAGFYEGETARELTRWAREECRHH